MQRAPRAFERRLTSHNRHVIFAALGSLVGAVVTWGILYWGAQTLILFVFTSVVGEAAQLPEHFSYYFLGAVAVLLTLAAVDRAYHPFPRPSDRSILGWHLVKEIGLLPAMLTFSIYDNLNAYQRLSRDLITEAWALFLKIQSEGKLSYFEVNLVDGKGTHTQTLLLLLQFAGLLDLHRGQDEWYYLIPSSQTEFCEALKLEPDPRI